MFTFTKKLLFLFFSLPKILSEFPLQSNSVLHKCYQCATNQSRGFCKSVFSFHLLRLYSDCCDVLDRQVLLPELHLFCFWSLFCKLQNPGFLYKKNHCRLDFFQIGAKAELPALLKIFRPILTVLKLRDLMLSERCFQFPCCKVLFQVLWKKIPLVWFYISRSFLHILPVRINHRYHHFCEVFLVLRCSKKL